MKRENILTFCQRIDFWPLIHIRVCIYEYTCKCTYTHTHTPGISIFCHKHTHTHEYIHTHIHTHTHTIYIYIYTHTIYIYIYIYYQSTVTEEFCPDPDETKRLITTDYLISRNLAVKFLDDTIDQSIDLCMVCTALMWYVLKFPQLLTLALLKNTLVLRCQ